MRLHVVALPHTKTTREYLPCAFTQKVRNFCRMMSAAPGFEVVHYGAEGSEPGCEHVQVISDAEQRGFFGGPEVWKSGGFFPVQFDAALPYWQLFNGRVIEALRERLQPRDIICLIGGHAHKPIADAFPAHISVEFGVGYEGTFARFRVFESYAWMHYLYGRGGVQDGNYFDAVIPNYIDPADFPEPVAPREGYALFVARFIQRKGPQVAVDATRCAGMRLVMAGQGLAGRTADTLRGQGFEVHGAAHVEHFGVVGAQRRADLMSKAAVLIMPTQYIGPFEGVAVEAMACGTPVIASDWGAFAETIFHGATGYRARTLGEHVWALRNLGKLQPAAEIRGYALGRYSMSVVMHRYVEYFEQLQQLWGAGWASLEYTEHKHSRGHFL